MAILRKNRVASPQQAQNSAKRFASTNSKSSNKFNPRLIFSQIVALQSIHYLILSFMFQINSFIYGTTITVDRIFTAKHLDLWTHEGRIDAATIIISTVFGSVLLAIIVEKSKKCLDFSVTLFFVHFLICTFYEGKSVLRSLDFWIVHVLGMIIMVLLGEYFCSRKELMDIPLL